jgi:hypothetical protein
MMSIIRPMIAPPPRSEGRRPMWSTVKKLQMVKMLRMSLMISEARKGSLRPARPKK